MNFEGAYLENGLMDSAQIWNLRCPTPKKFAQKILCVSAQGVLSYRCVKTAFFFTPVKYTLVCRTPKFSWFLRPQDTLSCVLIREDFLWVVSYKKHRRMKAYLWQRRNAGKEFHISGKIK